MFIFRAVHVMSLSLAVPQLCVCVCACVCVCVCVQAFSVVFETNLEGELPAHPCSSELCCVPNRAR